MRSNSGSCLQVSLLSTHNRMLGHVHFMHVLLTIVDKSHTHVYHIIRGHFLKLDALSNSRFQIDLDFIRIDGSLATEFASQALHNHLLC